MRNVGDTYTWGSHLGSNFAAGVRSAISAVESAASAVASAAASVLQFSAPDKGPWSGSERGGVTSGLHLGQNFADGMARAIPDVERASLALANAASVDASSTWETGARTYRAVPTASTQRTANGTTNLYIDGAALDASPQIMQAFDVFIDALATQYDLVPKGA